MTTTPPAQPQATAPAPKKGHRWLKILLALCALLILLLLLAPTLLSTSPGKSFLLAKVNARIPGKISADSLSLGWFSGAKVRNLQIKDPNGQTVLSLASADTGLTLTDALSTASLNLGNIVLRGLRATLITYPDGTTNLARALSAPAAPAGPPAPAPAAPASSSKHLVKGTLDAQDCQLTWTGQNAPPLTVDQISAKSTFNTNGGTCEIDLSANARAADGPSAPIAAHLSGTFFDDGTLKPLTALDATGKVTIQHLDLATLSPMLQAAGLKAALTGSSELTLTLAGGAHPTLTLDLPITNLAATGEATDGDTLRLPTATLTLNAALTADTLDIQKFQLASQLLNASAQGSVKLDAAPNAPTEPFTLSLAADVTGLKKQLPKLLNSVPDTRAAATLNGSADLAAKTFTISATSALSEKDDKTGQGNMLVLDPGTLLSWGAAPLDLRATATYDLARLQQIMSTSLPTGTTLAGARSVKIHLTGPLHLDAAGLQKFAALSLEPTAIGFDRIALKGFDLGKASVPFAMTSGVLTLTPTDVPANGGVIHLRGSLDLGKNIFTLDKPDKPTEFLSNLAINHELAAGALGFLPLVWGGDKAGNLAAVSGTLNVSLADASLPLDPALLKSNGVLNGSLRIDNLSTNSPVFKQLLEQLGPIAKITQPDILAIRGGQIPETPFALANGKITYHDLTIHANAVDIVLGGAVGLDQTIAMNMSINTKAANIPIPVTLKGTTTQPQLTVSPDALKNTLQNVAPKALENLLNRK